MAQRISKAEFAEKVLTSDKPVIVDFYSDSCIACKKLAPALADVEDDKEGQIEVYKVNTNYDSELVEEYGVMGNPTLLLFLGGEVKGRKVGAMTKKEIAEWLLNYNID